MGAPPARLVFLLQDLEFGGTQRQALELAARLDRQRFHVELWVLRAGDDLLPAARARGLTVTFLSRDAWVTPRALAHLWRRLQAAPVDLLFLLTVVPNIWGRILGRLAGVPCIVGNCRGGAAPRRQHERLLWPLAHHIICNAAALRDHLAQHCGVPRRRLSVIVNGVDTHHFQPPPGRQDGGPPRALALARFVPDKDHDTLIRAFARVSRRQPQAELWLVGDGPRREAAARLAEALLPAGAVRFFPAQPDVRPFLHQAGVIVLSSAAEALPNVVLEAMAAGLPVVATRVGGLAEVVDEGITGYLAPPRDPAALAEALDRVLADPAHRRALGQAGRRRAEQDFSLEAMVRRHEAVMVKLLGYEPGG
ncbi:MAG: glycosyltransferase family 4 protein [Deltaproteobacteria bacterium]|nr:glycosyltransferase family 4 protein [Deltaproteobacteria bacterium]